MINSQLKQLAAVAVVRSLPVMIKNSGHIPQGRLNGLLDRLLKESDVLLTQFKKVPKKDEAIMAEKVKLWAECAQWDEKENEISTAVAFLISVVVDFIPKNDKILSLLENIYNYFERADKINIGDDKEATRVATIWFEIFDN